MEQGGVNRHENPQPGIDEGDRYATIVLMGGESPVVLWVDDDVLRNDVFARFLHFEGFKVVVASTLSEGVRAMLSEPRLDIAILDMVVPVGKAYLFTA